MNCYYCDKIKASDSYYQGSDASYDLGSAAPRCTLHWRYVCGKCGEPSHFMSTAYDPEALKFFCSGCATGKEEVADPFWTWKYYFKYRSPWSGQWCPALDRLEYEGAHPLRRADAKTAEHAAISQQEYLSRYPEHTGWWRTEKQVTEADVQSAWNVNADRWDAGYDDDGDRNRRYQSDEPMLEMLGDVRGKYILDLGSGNGYLCRKLAKTGAITTGVELSDRFVQIAEAREAKEKLGIEYHHSSSAQMDFLPDSYFDKAVANYVLMDVLDYEAAVQEVFRVLRPGGRFVAVISHPCFSSGPAGWVRPAPDSPRLEDRFAYRVDNYFHRGPYYGQWGVFDPLPSFHRPLRDYWHAFIKAGFGIDAFEEPSITERGRRELPLSRIEYSLRIPYSCIFRIVKPGAAEKRTHDGSTARRR